MLEINNSETASSIQSILAADILSYALEFNIPVRQVIHEINASTGVSLSTLERIVNKPKSPRPFVKTVVSIYSFLFKTKSISEITTKVPLEIGSYIKKNSLSFSKSQDGLTFDVAQKEEELTSDHLFNQIYNMTGGDFGTEIETIRYNFGLSGLTKLDEMIELGFVVVDADEKLKRGKSLSWNRVAMVNFNNTLGDRIKKMKDFDLNEENLCTFQTYEVTASDATLIKNIYKDATYAAIEIAMKSEAKEENFKKLSFSTLVASTNLKGDE